MAARGKGAGYQGSKWLRRERRLALYSRDGLACCYCGHGVEDGAVLTLDHLRPYSKGGSHANSNLVTSCLRCNSARGTRSVAAFARDVAAYLNHGVAAEDIIRRIRNTVRRTVDVQAAKAIINRRSGYSAALNS